MLSLLHLRIRVSPALVTINICKHASCEGKESLKTLLRRGFTQKEDKNKTNHKLYPVVVTAVNEVAKRVKIHYVGIFGSLFVILELLSVPSSFSSSFCDLVISFFKDSSTARFSPLKS